MLNIFKCFLPDTTQINQSMHRMVLPWKYTVKIVGCNNETFPSCMVVDICAQLDRSCQQTQAWNSFTYVREIEPLHCQNWFKAVQSCIERIATMRWYRIVGGTRWIAWRYHPQENFGAGSRRGRDLSGAPQLHDLWQLRFNRTGPESNRWRAAQNKISEKDSIRLEKSHRTPTPWERAQTEWAPLTLFQYYTSLRKG